MEPWPLDRTKRSRSGQAGFAGLWRKWRFQSATAISAMPIGMPGWPDFAASTASMASARMEFASSASDALGRTGESIGGRKLYSAHARTSLRDTGRIRTPLPLRRARRGPLVRLPRRPAPGRNGTPRPPPLGRSARAAAAVLGPPAVAEKPQLVGGHGRADPISRA